MKKIISISLIILTVFSCCYCCFLAGATESDSDYSGESEPLPKTDTATEPETLPEEGGSAEDDIISPEIVSNITEEASCKGKVVEILSDTSGESAFADGFVPVRIILMKVEVLTGPRKGQILDVKQEIQPNDDGGLNDIRPAKKGDKITVFFSVDEYGTLLTGTMTDFYRSDTIGIFAFIFLIFLVIFCGFKGLKSVGALLITCIMVLFIMIPIIYDGGILIPTLSGFQRYHIFDSGIDPTLAAVVTSIFIIAISLVISYGFTHKTFAAALGIAGGTIVAGVLSIMMINILKLTGISNEESKSLVFTDNGASLDVSGILFAAVLIGALGGTIDVGISIASSLEELAEKAKGIRSSEIFVSGMKIGRDIMGASLNTLILAYVGGSMPILILFYAYNMPMIDIINTEQIASELLRALVGSFGLLCTVPITSFVCSVMMGRKKGSAELSSPLMAKSKAKTQPKFTKKAKKLNRKVWKISKGTIKTTKIN